MLGLVDAGDLDVLGDRQPMRGLEGQGDDEGDDTGDDERGEGDEDLDDGLVDAATVEQAGGGREQAAPMVPQRPATRCTPTTSSESS